MSQYAMRKVNILAPFGCQNQTDPLPANSTFWFPGDFKSKLDQIHPPYGQTIPMDFGDLEEDEGKGL
jgi:hypothetical protein